jgi:hypothetical protein
MHCGQTSIFGCCLEAVDSTVIICETPTRAPSSLIPNTKLVMSSGEVDDVIDAVSQHEAVGGNRACTRVSSIYDCECARFIRDGDRIELSDSLG